ncbi:MAG: prolyl oligopeptidase family serine peptidase [Planctomycetota bacterium]|nr:prolyl oligopeptidase family serine peptidase [Planctomycetota bacterium]MDA1178938.1 prolyl oligopeptidase family serine peptidase [Planctomycetota bacterium]
MNLGSKFGQNIEIRQSVITWLIFCLVIVVIKPLTWQTHAAETSDSPRGTTALTFTSASILLPNQVNEYRAVDSLTTLSDTVIDAQACLQSLAWPPVEFSVQSTPSQDSDYDALIRFPSPIATGDPLNDQVVLEWYPARKCAPGVALPALVVVHESGSGMKVGRLFAQNLRSDNLHTFLVHLPHYGRRRLEDQPKDPSKFVEVLRQGVADVRRARDAVAALPDIDPQRIGLQGTSLGGFVAATVAGLDRGYSRIFVTLAGGNLYDILQSGGQDAAKVRQMLAENGYTGQRLEEAIRVVEPLRLAHRIDPAKMWMFSAKQDRVVPLKNALELARAARLTEDHHIQVDGDHYTAILHFPVIVARIREQM